MTTSLVSSGNQTRDFSQKVTKSINDVKNQPRKYVFEQATKAVVTGAAGITFISNVSAPSGITPEYSIAKTSPLGPILTPGLWHIVFRGTITVGSSAALTIRLGGTDASSGRLLVSTTVGTTGLVTSEATVNISNFETDYKEVRVWLAANLELTLASAPYAQLTCYKLA